MDIDQAVTNYNIRISPQTFVIALAISLTIAFIFAALRTVVRLRQNRTRKRTLQLEDYFLFYAVLVSAICAGVVYSIRDQIYLQIYVGLNWQPRGLDFNDIMLVFEQRIMVCSALIWSVIYAIKFSFLALFHRVDQGVRKLKVYWRIVTVITAVCGAVSIPLSFIICGHFGNDYMTYCPINSQLANERIYMHTTTALDILTDLLLISIPILLLRNIQISWQRKATLITMLCLSTFCIFVAAIRTSLADLPVNGVIDTSWLVFWQGIEAAVAVIIVSCTAFRGLFAQLKTSGISDVEKAGRNNPLAVPGRAPLSKAKPTIEHKAWYMSERHSSDAQDLASSFEDTSSLYLAETHVVENEVIEPGKMTEENTFDKPIEKE